MRSGTAAAMLALLTISCGSAPTGEKNPSAHVKITQFRAATSKIARGLKGSLCYGVENATRIALTPAADAVYPASLRCIEIAPTAKTTYTLTAWGQDGASESKSVDVNVAAPPPRLYDLKANSVRVHSGEEVRVCFKVENTRKVEVNHGKLDRNTNCVTDHPANTTTYRVTAIGGDNEVDSGAVTVKIR